MVVLGAAAVLAAAGLAAADRDESGVREVREESGVLAGALPGVVDLGADTGVLGLARAAAVAR